MTFGWTDIEDISIALTESHPDRDPLSVTFPELRKLVESLPDFEPDPEHRVNEQILEAIQAGWYEEKQDQAEDDDEDGRSYTPVNPFR